MRRRDARVAKAAALKQPFDPEERDSEDDRDAATEVSSSLSLLSLFVFLRLSLFPSCDISFLFHFYF
jgi:hypothetical protein